MFLPLLQKQETKNLIDCCSYGGSHTVLHGMPIATIPEKWFLHNQYTGNNNLTSRFEVLPKGLSIGEPLQPQQQELSLVERYLGKVEVAGSKPAQGFFFLVLLSLSSAWVTSPNLPRPTMVAGLVGSTLFPPNRPFSIRIGSSLSQTPLPSC
jgi:hypothetical protein